MKFNIKNFSIIDLLLFSMITVDTIFIILHIFYKFEFISNSRFLITKDHGYAEGFQYLKEGFIASIFLFTAIKRKIPGYFAWTLLFFYALVDDFFRIHERGGSFIKHHFNLHIIPLIGAQNTGELIVTTFSGIALVSFLGISYYYSDKDFKRISRKIFSLVLILVFFGVIVDLGGALSDKRIYRGIFTLLDDGGEMMVMSFILWFILKLKIYKKNTVIK